MCILNIYDSHTIYSKDTTTSVLSGRRLAIGQPCQGLLIRSETLKVVLTE